MGGKSRIFTQNVTDAANTTNYKQTKSNPNPRQIFGIWIRRLSFLQKQWINDRKHGQGTHCTKMGAHSLAENISNTLKFNQPICIIGLKVWGIVEKSSSGIRSPCINPNFPKSNFFFTINLFAFLKIDCKTFQTEKKYL